LEIAIHVEMQECSAERQNGRRVKVTNSAVFICLVQAAIKIIFYAQSSRFVKFVENLMHL
jgi:hypothetical protein